MNTITVDTDKAWADLAEHGKTMYKSGGPYIFKRQIQAEAREEGVRVNTRMYKYAKPGQSAEYRVYVYLLNRR
jgi:hypothetical protein